MEAGQFLHEQFDRAVAAWREAAARVPVDPMAISRALAHVSEAKKALDTYHFYVAYMPLAIMVVKYALMYQVVCIAIGYQINQKDKK